MFSDAIFSQKLCIFMPDFTSGMSFCRGNLAYNEAWFLFTAFNGAETVIDGMKESVKALMDMFRLPIETDFVIYRILKDYRGDFKLASSRLLEGTATY